MEEDEITSEHKETIVEHELLATRMANFVENIYNLRDTIVARPLRVEDFIYAQNNAEWSDLRELNKKVKKRCSCKMPKLLRKYQEQTKVQIDLFKRGVSLLDNEEFRTTIQDKITKKPVQTFFIEKVCRQKKMTPTKWLGLRTIALSSLREKLKEKTTKEQIFSCVDQAPPYVSGLGCGVGLMALFTPLWPYGATIIGVSSCICLTCQHEIYDTCKSHSLYCSNHDIDNKLQRTIQLLQFNEEKIQPNTSGKNIEKEHLLQN